MDVLLFSLTSNSAFGIVGPPTALDHGLQITIANLEDYSGFTLKNGSNASLGLDFSL
jgi:hypothetical protein